MRELDIVHLYEGESGNETQINNFIDRSISKIKIKTEYDKIQEDLEWIEVFEEVIPHIDSILRNPNRFIINEEEIVKIELAATKSPATSFDLYVWIVLGLAIILLIIILICVNRDKYGSVSRKRKAN